MSLDHGAASNDSKEALRIIVHLQWMLIQGVSKRALQWYSEHHRVAGVYTYRCTK
jgi:hypothetical protein